MRADSALARRGAYGHWITERIRWSDTDQFGHVNNLAISAYFETGRTEMLRSVFARDAPRRVLLLLAHIAIDYLGELHWPGDVDVGTGIIDCGRSSVRLGQAVFSGARCISTAESVLVHIDEHTRRSRELPDWLREHLSAYRTAGTSPAG